MAQSYGILNAQEINGINTSRNYILNPSASFNVSGWVVYKDSSAALPADGTGQISAPATTLTRATSSPLRGTGSFLIAGPSSDVRGEGVSYDFTIDTADKAKMLSISFDYSLFSGTLVTGDLAVYIYDVTNATVIQPAGYQIQAIGGATPTLPSKHIATFQTASNSTSYRLIIHRAVTTATTFSMYMDNVQVGPQVVQYGAPVTDWASYTPTGTWAANTTYTGKWRRVGDSMQVYALVENTGAPSGTFTLNLPSGHTIDSAKITAASDKAGFGTAYLFDSDTAGSRTGATIGYNSATSINLLAEGATTVGATSPYTVASGDKIMVEFIVPIAGWSSTVQMSSDTDTRVVAAAGQIQAQSIGSGSEVTLGTWTKIIDTHGTWDASTGIYTVGVPGIYECSSALLFVANATGSRYITFQKNGSGSFALSQNSVATSGTVDCALAIPGTLVSCVAGDTIRMRAFQNSGGALAVQSGSNTTFNVRRLTGPSAIAASEKIAARYTTNAGGSVSNSTNTYIDFEDIVVDTHASATGVGGGVTTTVQTGFRYVIPRPGLFRVFASLAFNTSALATTERIEIGIVQNTSTRQHHTIAGSGASNYAQSVVTCIINALAGDTVQVLIFQNSGGALTLQPDGAYNTFEIESL